MSECVICSNNSTAQLPCGHIVCNECHDKLVTTNYKFGDMIDFGRHYCPICRVPIICDNEKINELLKKRNFNDTATYFFAKKCNCIVRTEPVCGNNVKCPDLCEKHELDTDIQYCPNCDIAVKRTDACAHMTCQCGTHFCIGCAHEFTGREAQMIINTLWKCLEPCTSEKINSRTYESEIRDIFEYPSYEYLSYHHDRDIFLRRDYAQHLYIHAYLNGLTIHDGMTIRDGMQRVHQREQQFYQTTREQLQQLQCEPSEQPQTSNTLLFLKQTYWILFLLFVAFLTTANVF